MRSEHMYISMCPSAGARGSARSQLVSAQNKIFPASVMHVGSSLHQMVFAFFFKRTKECGICSWIDK